MPARCPVARRRCLPLSLPIPLPPGPPGTRPAPATCRPGRCPPPPLPPPPPPPGPGPAGPPPGPQPHAAGPAVRAGHSRPPRGPPMTWDVALILLTDGLANGAIYLLAGLGLVL